MCPPRDVSWVPATCGALLAAATMLHGSESRAHDLMPAPVSVALSAEGFSLEGQLTVAVVGPTNERLERAAERLAVRLADRTGSPLEARVLDDPRRASLVIRCPGTLAGSFPSLEDDESYRLLVGDRGVRLDAPGPLGALRGLATLAQLATRENGGWALRGAEIEDAPRFPWRGLMIDVVRHWQPLEVIERNLDAMEAVKLNVLHLHLTDDQGFRVESRTHPRLHERGSDGRYFSQDEIEASHRVRRRPGCPDRARARRARSRDELAGGLPRAAEPAGRDARAPEGVGSVSRCPRPDPRGDLRVPRRSVLGDGQVVPRRVRPRRR